MWYWRYKQKKVLAQLICADQIHSDSTRASSTCNFHFNTNRFGGISLDFMLWRWADCCCTRNARVKTHRKWCVCVLSYVNYGRCERIANWCAQCVALHSGCYHVPLEKLESLESLERQITLYVLCYPCDGKDNINICRTARKKSLESRRLRSANGSSVVRRCWYVSWVWVTNKRIRKYKRDASKRYALVYIPKKKLDDRSRSSSKKKNCTKCVQCIRYRNATEETSVKTYQISPPRQKEHVNPAPPFPPPVCWQSTKHSDYSYSTVLHFRFTDSHTYLIGLTTVSIIPKNKHTNCYF